VVLSGYLPSPSGLARTYLCTSVPVAWSPCAPTIINRLISVCRLCEMPIQSCGHSVSAPPGKAGVRLNAHTALQAKRQRSAWAAMYRNRPIIVPVYPYTLAAKSPLAWPLIPRLSSIIPGLTRSLNDQNYFELAHVTARDEDLYGGLTLMNFLGNHDTPRIASRLTDPEAHYPLAAAALLLSRGVPCIYYGDELGLLGAPGRGVLLAPSPSTIRNT